MVTSENNFRDKRILVTGASKGLGHVCASELEKLGAKLFLAGRNLDRLEKLRSSFSSPQDHGLFVGDLVSPDIIEQLIEDGHKHLGGFDVVLHVMGGGYGFRDALLSHEQLNILFQVNVTAAAEINRLVVPAMVKNSSGYIVHVGSIASCEATASVGYNTVKSALAAYVRSLGRELAESGVVVTGVLPGAFYAPENSWRRLEASKPEVVKEFIGNV